VASALRYASTACTPPAPDCSIPASSPPMVLAALRLRLRVGCSRRGISRIGIASTPRADGRAKARAGRAPRQALALAVSEASCLAWLVPGAVVVRKAIFTVRGSNFSCALLRGGEDGGVAETGNRTAIAPQAQGTDGGRRRRRRRRLL
jgi:hypothetical protein